MTQDNDLTICSVYHSNETKRLVELNYDITSSLNPEAHFQWVIGDNTPTDFKEKLDSKKFLIVPGAGEIQGVSRMGDIWGSYRHGQALNRTIAHIDTRFVLFLDIDFYILIPDWIRTIPTYMQENNLTFFGTPWHPRFMWKWRYFPGPHALFVDMSRIDPSQLDFEPDYYGADDKRSHGWRKSRFKHLVPFAVRRRLGLNTSRDTGYKIYKKFFRTASYECPQVVVESMPKPDRFLPDQFSLAPKRSGYLTCSRFRDNGYPDFLAQGWEEFMWKNKPYAFHIRGGSRKLRDIEGTITLIRNMLGQLMVSPRKK